jgi:uncharacterized protein YbbC (DUF1343 family)
MNKHRGLIVKKITQDFFKYKAFIMYLSKGKIMLLIVIFTSFFCSLKSQTIFPGANDIQKYKPELWAKKIAIVANQTSMVGNIHLLDTLLSLGIKVQKVFCPEHGFRGNVEAGERVKTETDSKSGIKIVSLYGRHYKPRPADLKDIDIVVFDIQDVGVRCYTYLSTLHYVMEACAENNMKLIVLDRPNPNGFYLDGPVLDLKYKSFVGLHPVPLVYGMTIGEYALMINGEKWLKNELHCDLRVIPCENYKHHSMYRLPVRPSPNLQDMQAVYLYPSLTLFEGTLINIGRGTDFPFKVFGSPKFTNLNFTYVPKGNGAKVLPMHCDTLCYGVDLRNYQLPDSDCFSIKWLIQAYVNFPDKAEFFNIFFYNLSGNKELRQQIEAGKSEQEIRNSWKEGINKFKKIRAKYLLYP